MLPVDASVSEHDAVLPPLLPAQLHDHGPLPLTVDAVPARKGSLLARCLPMPRSRSRMCRSQAAEDRAQSRSPWSRRRCRRNSMTTVRCR